MRKEGIRCLLLFSLVASIIFSVCPLIAAAHYPGAVIQSNWATTIPTTDGTYGPIPEEWEDATILDFQAEDPNNPIEAYGYFKNDTTYLYICLDVVGDTTPTNSDASLVGFDTGHDAVPTDGGEDNFGIEGDGMTEHWVWSASAGWYATCCSPFNPALPLHAGLAGAAGSGPSPNSPVDHRIYEYRIPLALIQVSPGDTIGFAMDGEIYYGIYDDDLENGDQWPFWKDGPIDLDEYGDLILASPPVPVGGIAVPVSKLGLLAPWMGLAALGSLAALTVALVRRRKG